MNPAAELPPPLRRAALTLHALSDADRGWLLAALPGTQRAVLQPLLAELRQLGIPREDAFLAGAQEHGAPAAAAGNDQWLLELDDVGVTALAGVLQAQPAQFTQALLALRPWPWRAQLLEALGEQTRSAVLAATLPAPCPRLRAAILQALQPKWQAARDAQPVRPQGAWGRARARLARIRRLA